MDGCNIGTCKCQDGHQRNTGNSCKTAKKVGEDCNESGDCYDNNQSVECKQKKCSCKSGLSVDEDEKSCSKHVGDPCASRADCSDPKMDCEDKKCACISQWKTEGDKCVATELGDDCSSGKLCVAGSCKDKKCSCSNDLVAYLKQYCINKDAKTDVEKGEVCTPYSVSGKDGKFCKEDLKCTKCPGETKRVCSGASVQSGILLAIIFAVFGVVCM